jgi:hypothetical protein
MWLLVLIFVAGVVWLHVRHVQERTTRLIFELTEEADQRFSRLSAGVQALAASQRLWRLKTQEHTSDWKRNAGASRLIGRATATACFSPPRFVETNLQIPSLIAGGLRLHFMPDRLLLQQDNRWGSVSYSALTARSEATRFIEHGELPADAEIVDKTWQYVNKGGGPDRRFNNNRQIPIARYGQIVLQSITGLNLMFHTSRVQSAFEFAAQLTASCAGTDRAQTFRSASARSVSDGVAAALSQLGLDTQADADEIRSAYRRMAMMYHPDKVSQMAPEFQVLAEERMKEINAAYALLSGNS